jgi:chromosome segregation ATPase
VDRTFIYRHRDLLAQVHAMAAQPATGTSTSTSTSTPSRASLQADLLAAQQRAVRLHTRVRQLEQRLSQHLGEQTWRESGLGAPDDIDELKQRIVHLEQQAVDLHIQLDERDQDLAAARAANRELMTQLNARPTR